MKILDWYIIRKYLITFFFVVLVAVTVICIIDFTEQNDDFIKRQAPMSEIILSYYLNLIPYFASFLSPIMIFIATILVTARLASNTEIIAILSSGVSFNRFLRPYVIGSLFLGAIIFYLNGWVIPQSNKTRIDFEIQYLEKPYHFNEQNIHMKTSPNTYVYMRNYNNSINVAYQFAIENIVDTELKYKIKARSAHWVDSCRCWRMKKFVERRFTEDGDEIIKVGEVKDTTLNMYPKDFQSDRGKHETLTIPQLSSFITELKERGAENTATYEVELYARYTYPFAFFILTLMGVIVSARKSREGVGFQIALGFLLAFIFIILVLVGRTMAQAQGLAPLMSALIPNLIFSIIGIIMYKTIPR